MWPFTKKPEVLNSTPVFFTNTLSGKKEVFAPQKAGVATLYSCGPTVYGPQHIGNLRAALFADLIARVLTQSGFHVRRVINITDVGHLVSDADEGEDKMAVGAAREHTTPAEVADRYTKQYLEDIRALNLDTEHILFPRATEYIDQQVALVKALQEKGFAYATDDGVYFDTSKFPNYGKLGGVAEVRLMGGARVKMEGGKRNLHDFALWRKAKPNDLQQWPSPWGPGNPGWHIECSSMIRALLGVTIDIHSGGMDHIPVHHNNEIAQSEAAHGKPLARYWLHEAFVTLDGEKISKSKGHEVLLHNITERGIHPLALRYFYLQAHYRSPIMFSYEALEGAHEALKRLWRLSREVASDAKGKTAPSEAARQMVSILRDDLATPAALALLWDTLKDEDIEPEVKLSVLRVADAVLGLDLLSPPAELAPVATRDLPSDIQELILKRDEARSAGDFAASDELRINIQNSGYRVDDGPNGTVVTPTR
ncbi:MAG: cysteine--tRNA ligase [Patescibacteria group bacterium]